MIERPRNRSVAPVAVLAAAGLTAMLAAPAPISAQTPAASAQEFRFSPGDRVLLSVWPDSTLGGTYPVEENGQVHLPLLGELSAADRTVALLRDELRTRYAEDLRLPVVSVTAEFRVSVLGAVRSPGVYWVEPGFGVFELISVAGGLTEHAEEEEVTITRRSGEAYRIDAARLLVAGSPEASLMLRSGDRLVVPEGRRWNWGVVLQSLTLVATIVNIANR